jgi:formylglycine-generating enzyme required for sulfatase activity
MSTARSASGSSRHVGNAFALLALALMGCASNGNALRDCPTCPAMVRIPAGNAVFGSVAGALYQRPDELPRRAIRIERPFAVSQNEITRGEYAAFVEATNYPAGGDCLTDRHKLGDWQYDAQTTWRDPGFTQADDHPVACVNYDDALAYVSWLNSMTAGGYRLLTELEWEYVAAAGATTLYPWGDDKIDGCRYANGFDDAAWMKYAHMDTSAYPLFDPLPCRDGWLNTNPAGALAPNKFGVYGMIGNVSEWVADCYVPSHQRLTENHMAEAPEGPCAQRVAKGGSWGTLAHNLRTAERFPYAATHRDDSIGIRVARDR